MGRAPRWTAEMLSTILRRRLAGETAARIATDYGISAAAIWAQLTVARKRWRAGELEIPPPPPPSRVPAAMTLAPITADELNVLGPKARRILEGRIADPPLSFETLAVELDISVASVRQLEAYAIERITQVRAQGRERPYRW
jgi:hypothetical protein